MGLTKYFSTPRKASIGAGLILLGLVAGSLWLRWPTLAFNVWNVDEAIHAAAARALLDGGVMYRDAVDQRTPLTYYAVAAIFRIAGPNNLWAVRAFVAALIGITAWLLFLTGRKARNFSAGLWAAVIYTALATGLLHEGDANAANTEWFVAFFSSAAAWLTLGALRRPSGRTVFFTGALLGCSFLSKQPALLDLAAPAGTLLWLNWQRTLTTRELRLRLMALLGGWLAPVALTLAYFAWHRALPDLLFYTWTYNLAYYGPEISTADRAASLLVPFQFLAATQCALLVLWLVGAGVVHRRLVQRQPTPEESGDSPGTIYLMLWTLGSLAGAASGGRGFSHYCIQFLPVLSLGAGAACAGAARIGMNSRAAWLPRLLAALALGGVLYQLSTTTLTARHRTHPTDPSLRAAAYVREHSTADDRIFVWGFHPDIYLFSERKAASRFVYGNFLTGLVPWSNVALDRDTTYAVVPGAMDVLLRDLAASRPVFIVDCSAGPNRFWQKYPLEKYPALQGFIQAHYKAVESGQFVPQGFRLYQRLRDNEPAEAATRMPELPADIAASLSLRTLGRPAQPVSASAPNGASLSQLDGRAEYFAHAPSRLIYPVPAGATRLRGGFGIRPAAFAADNLAPTDGAEFTISWRPPTGAEQVLLRRLLQPREIPADRPIQFFSIPLPDAAGEIVLNIGPGPTGNPSSDWTFWTDLTLETSR